jgi:protein dithiol oxidoreductase (disulfide-forming)
MFLIRCLAVSMSFFAVSGYAQNEPVAGTHFREVLAAPVASSSGIVEVAEFFMYSCSHCAALSKESEAWAKKYANDKNVFVTRVPVVFNPRATEHSRMYYALQSLQAMSQNKDLHQKIFSAIHDEKKRLLRPEEQADFLAQFGIDRAKYLAAFDSPQVRSDAQWAENFVRQQKIDSVPAISIGGRFVTTATMAGGPSHMLQVADYMIEQVRKGDTTSLAAKPSRVPAASGTPANNAANNVKPPATPPATVAASNQRTHKWPNGDQYTGEWNADLPHGRGKLIKADGLRAEGEFRAGKFFTGTQIYPDGSRREVANGMVLENPVDRLTKSYTQRISELSSQCGETFSSCDNSCGSANLISMTAAILAKENKLDIINKASQELQQCSDGCTSEKNQCTQQVRSLEQEKTRAIANLMSTQRVADQEKMVREQETANARAREQEQARQREAVNSAPSVASQLLGAVGQAQQNRLDRLNQEEAQRDQRQPTQQAQASDRSESRPVMSQQEIAACSDEIKRKQIESQSWGGDVNAVANRLGRFQKDLFEGRCAEHPEAQAYITSANRMLGYRNDTANRNPSSDAGVMPAPSSSAGDGSPSSATGKTAARHVHNPANEAAHCISLVRPKGYKNLQIKNNCDFLVAVSWPGFLANIGAGKSISSHMENGFKFAACKGRPHEFGVYQSKEMKAQNEDLYRCPDDW